MIYSIPYVLLVMFYGVLALLVHQRKDDAPFCRNVNLLGCVVYLLFFGLRGFVMHDWMNYYPEFEKADFSSFQGYSLGFDREPGWMLVELACKSLVDNYHFFVFVVSLLCLLLLVRFLRQYVDNIMLGMVIFLVFDGMVLSVNVMRNAISLLIFLNALPFLFQRRALPYFLMCALAFTFHYSGIVYFPLYFFLHRRLNKWVYMAICGACVLIYLSNIPVFLTLVRLSGVGGEIIENKLEAYMDISNQLRISIGFLERLMTMSLVFCYYEKIHEFRKENTMFVNAFVIYMAAALLFSDFSEISKRINMLFVFSYWILWGDLIKCFYYDNNRRLFLAFLSVYCILKIAAPVKDQPVCEYDNLLFGIKSYPERKAIFERTFEDE